MVGVPGRSKGCNTCLRRKIKCDQGTPSCRNCLKGGRLCAGYIRKRGYVFSQGASPRIDPQHPNHGESTISHQGRWRATVLKDATSTKSQSTEEKIRGAQAKLTWASSNGTADSLLSHRISDSTPVQQQLQYIFLNAYMPEESLSNKDKTYINGNWLVQLRNETLDSPALDASIAAYATAQIGRNNDDAALIQKSREMYDRSLQQLRTALGNPKSRVSDETLATCLALSVYELTESNGANSAYRTHLLGALMLLQIRGPDAYNTPLAHSLFLGLRRQVLIGDFLDHHNTFPNEPQWREAPWRVFPKSPLDGCFDVIFDLSAVECRWKDVCNETDRTRISESCSQVIKSCLSADSTLRNLYDNLAASGGPGPLYWPAFSTLESSLDNSHTGKMFPVSNHFTSVALAYMLATYWSAILQANHLLVSAYDKLATIDPSLSVVSDKHRSICMSMVENICQSTEYLLQETAGKLGPSVAVRVLRACMPILENDPEVDRQKRWIEEILGLIAKKLNLRMKGALWD